MNQKQTDNRDNTDSKDNKRYGHKTQVLDTGKVTGDLIRVFFTEMANAFMFIFSYIKTRINERHNRKDQNG